MATPIRQRLLDLATDIATSPPEDLAFTHSVLAQTSLPTAKPPDGMLRWERRQGRATLLVVAGEALDPKTQKFAQLPLPYGPKARLLLMHLNSEAVRRQSPINPGRGQHDSVLPAGDGQDAGWTPRWSVKGSACVAGCGNLPAGHHARR